MKIILQKKLLMKIEALGFTEVSKAKVIMPSCTYSRLVAARLRPDAHPVLLAVVDVSPAALVAELAGGPPGAGHDDRAGRGDHHPPHATGLLGGAQHVQRPFHCRHYQLLLQPTMHKRNS
jgi:hypothetical protein